MNTKRLVKPVIGLCVSAFFIWLVARALPFSELMAALRETQLGWIAAAVAMFLLGYTCRIWRWRLMLIHENPSLSWRRCAVPFMTSIAANNVLPFRAGDILRAVGFSQWLGISTVSVMATLLVERLLDFLVLLLALGLALTFVANGNTVLDTLLGVSSAFLIFLAVFISCILLFPQIFEPAFRLIPRALQNRLPGLAQKINDESNKLFNTLHVLSRGHRIITLLFWSLLVWGFEAMVFYMVALSVPAVTDPMVAWLAMPVGTLSTLLPSTPGYVGTFHYFVISVTESWGNPTAAAGAFAVMVHLVLWVTATLIGAATFVYWVLTGNSERSL